MVVVDLNGSHDDSLRRSLLITRRSFRLGRIESGARRGDGVEFGAVAKALKMDPLERFTRERRPQDRMECPTAAMPSRVSGDGNLKE